MVILATAGRRLSDRIKRVAFATTDIATVTGMSVTRTIADRIVDEMTGKVGTDGIGMKGGYSAVGAVTTIV